MRHAAGAVLIAMFVAAEATERRAVPGLSDLPTTNDDVDFEEVNLASPTPCMAAMRGSMPGSTPLDGGDNIDCDVEDVSIAITADSIKTCVADESFESNVGGRRFLAKVRKSCFLRGGPGLSDLPTTNDAVRFGDVRPLLAPRRGGRVNQASPTLCMLAMRGSMPGSTPLDGGDIIECDVEDVSIAITADSIKTCVADESFESNVGGRRFEAKVAGRSCFTFGR